MTCLSSFGSSPVSFLGESGVILVLFFFFNVTPLSKQNSPRWDAVICGVTPRAILFAHVPNKWDAMP